MGIVHLNYDVQCNWARSEENSIDGAHPTFVHSAFGNKRDPRLMIVEPVAHEWGSSTYRERPPAEYANLSKMTKQVIEKKRGNNKAYTWFSIVGVSHLIDIERSNGVRHVTLAARTPIDADNTRIFSHQVRNFLPGPEHDEERLQGRINAANEDTVVSQNVNPRYLPRTMSGELLVESDQNEAPFRRLIYKLAKRGWEIDIDEVANSHAITPWQFHVRNVARIPGTGRPNRFLPPIPESRTNVVPRGHIRITALTCETHGSACTLYGVTGQLFL